MKIPLVYGIGITIATGVITLVAHLLGYWTDPEKLMMGMAIGGLCGIATLTIGIVLGTRRVRAASGAGRFTYGNAYISGLLIALCAAVCGLIFNFVFFKYLVPDFADTQVEWMRSFMEKMNAPADKIEEAIEGIRTKATLGAQLRNGLLGTVILGAIISLITSAFLKRNPADDETLVS
jgi:hypothetical protein